MAKRFGVIEGGKGETLEAVKKRVRRKYVPEPNDCPKCNNLGIKNNRYEPYYESNYDQHGNRREKIAGFDCALCKRRGEALPHSFSK